MNKTSKGMIDMQTTMNAYADKLHEVNAMLAETGRRIVVHHNENGTCNVLHYPSLESDYPIPRFYGDMFSVRTYLEGLIFGLEIKQWESK
ncbi:hypothetical protein ACWA2C_16120 [Priestia megaterium]